MKGQNLDVTKLANALATALVGALDTGSKEAQDSGGWESIFRHGPQKFLTGYKAPSGVPDAIYAHGPNGIFSMPGIENIVVNAHMVPQDLDQLLGVYPTRYMNPLYPIFTGFSEDAGSEPSGVCEDCLGGTMQGGQVTAQFGHVCRGSDEIHIMRTIQMVNRGETTPLTLLGDVLGPGGLTKMPNTPAEWLEVVTNAEMVKIAILLQRKLIKMTWAGDPANNTLGGGYREFPGLNILVGTGKVDAITGVALTAWDSLVMDYKLTGVCDSLNGNDIVTYLSTMEYYTRHNADRMGLMPVEWVFAMRPELWQELTACWPCKYNTNRCSTLDQNTGVGGLAVVMGDQMISQRDKMRQGLTIDINGRNYPVVLCDGMVEENGDASQPNYNPNLVSGNYASSIFMLPLSVRGGMRTLYWEHLDYSLADADIAKTRSMNDFWTDGGRFFWTIERLRGCYKMNAEIDPRIILRTPHVAARLDNIQYTPLLHLRSPFYGDPYFKKGGQSSMPSYGDNLYSEWNRNPRG